jgi:hypothetical protein
MNDLVNDIIGILKPVSLSCCTTYCSELARSIPDSANFKRKELHYTASGMRAVYACGIDGGDYEILITPLKRSCS